MTEYLWNAKIRMGWKLVWELPMVLTIFHANFLSILIVCISNVVSLRLCRMRGVMSGAILLAFLCLCLCDRICGEHRPAVHHVDVRWAAGVECHVWRWMYYKLIRHCVTHVSAAICRVKTFSSLWWRIVWQNSLAVNTTM